MICVQTKRTRSGDLQRTENIASIWVGVLFTYLGRYALLLRFPVVEQTLYTYIHNIKGIRIVTA